MTGTTAAAGHAGAAIAGGPADEAWAAIEEKMDAAVREDYFDFHERHYRRLPADVVRRIEALHAEGMALAQIAELLDRLGQRPLARRDRAWSGFMVRVVLAIAADPDLLALLVEPGEASAA